MNLEVIKVVSTRVVGRGMLYLHKYAPEILTAAGIIGGVTAAVMASKATLELREEMKYPKKMIAGHKKMRKVNTEAAYPTATYQKDIAISYYRGAQVALKLYGPAIALGAASIVCILSAHGILYRRNAALMAAYNALDAAYKSYRKRVIEEFGEQKDWDYRHGISEEVVEATDDKGKKTKKKQLVRSDIDGYSEYARHFAPGHVEWKNDPSQNLFYLRCRQSFLNDKLRAQGHLFLNEAYDFLEYPRTKAGAVVGWVIGKDGDSVVDFGLDDINNPSTRDFLDGIDASLVIDFNVDGVILDKI